MRSFTKQWSSTMTGRAFIPRGLRHGDAMFVSDIDPLRPGLEVFSIQENEDDTVRFMTPGAALRDARTGEILFSHSPGVDVPQGSAADIDPRYPGLEVWSQPGGLYTAQGDFLGASHPTTGFTLWWDGDAQREFLGRGGITKWDWNTGQEIVVEPLEMTRRLRYPTLSGDIWGDWREELILPAPDLQSLRIYTSTIPTDNRLTTLLHDRQYRLSITWQNVVYNKPPQPSFHLGTLLDQQK